MSFRIWTIFYVFALAAAAMTTFGGAAGSFVTAVVLGFWGSVFYSRRRGWVLSAASAVLLVLAVLTALMLPALYWAREAARRSQCHGQMKQLAHALIAHHATASSFPSAFQADERGKPLLSWRVAVLPHMEHFALYSQFDKSKAWSDPANSALSATGIRNYCCPSNFVTPQLTSYFAIVDPRAAWLTKRGRSLDEFEDGPESTIQLIEAPGRQVRWAEPKDLTLDEAIDLLSHEPAEGDGHEIDYGFFYKLSRGRHVAFADGRVRYLHAPLEAPLAKALLTIDGGERIDLTALDRAVNPQLDYAKCYSFGLFAALALAPVFWIGRRGDRRASEIDAA